MAEDVDPYTAESARLKEDMRLALTPLLHHSLEEGTASAQVQLVTLFEQAYPHLAEDVWNGDVTYTFDSSDPSVVSMTVSIRVVPHDG